MEKYHLTIEEFNFDTGKWEILIDYYFSNKKNVYERINYFSKRVCVRSIVEREKV